MYKSDTIISTLHMAGCTSRDFRRFYELWKYDDTIYAEIRDKSWRHYSTWMPPERQEKIETTLQKISLDRVETLLSQHHITIIRYTDSWYPKRLKNITNPPFILYIRGVFIEQSLTLWIVGSRKSSNYGERILDTIIPWLVSVWIWIVSGWAYGIDSMAHKRSLTAGGYTICVFWSSILKHYPEKNSQLFEDIVRSWGALISPFSLEADSEPYLFPQRNELVAGLSDGIIIPEAWEKSGTLITAWLALEQGKDVFCFPGDIFRGWSQGTNTLIAKWEAKCTQNLTDILEEYLPTKITPIEKKREFETKEASDIYKYICSGYDTIEKLIIKTEIPVDILLQTLSIMEISGYIEIRHDGTYLPL